MNQLHFTLHLISIITLITQPVIAQQPAPSTASLTAMLDSINISEQKPIRLRDELIQIHGPESQEFRDQDVIVHHNHDINEIKIRNYLDQYGWPMGIGPQGNRLICNVLQHSPPNVRMAYLPMMRTAVEDGLLEPMLLVRAEDRVATDQGKLQIYGGQIKYYPESKTFNVWPIYDPSNVDKRRASMGLAPMVIFLANRRFPIEWDVEEQI